MSNGLSQAEIDALLRGETPGEAVSPPEEDPGYMMSQDEIAAMLAAAGSEEVPDIVPQNDDPGHIMSQDEIAAMLAAAGDSESKAPLMPGVELPPLSESVQNSLTPTERDALGEIGNISMGTSATTLFALLNRRVDITTPRVSITTMRHMAQAYPMPFVSVEVKYTLGLEGINCLFLQEKDVKIITDLMMGGDGTNISGDLNEMHLSCIAEVMNQMVGASSTSLSQMLKNPIDISPPYARQITFGETEMNYPFTEMDEPMARTSFTMIVEGLINSEIMQLTPIPFAKSMVQKLMGMSSSYTPETSARAASAPAPAPMYEPAHTPTAGTPQPVYNPVVFSEGANMAASAPVAANTPQQGMPGYDTNLLNQYPPQYQPQQQYQPQYQQPQYPPQYPQQYPPQYPQYPPQYQPPAHPPVDVKPAQFGSFGVDLGAAGLGENMDILLDVPLSVTVELGKSKKYIKEILDFNVGTIIVLDKMAGDLVDVVVNGKLIAKGEVVIIDDSYGCRITDIVSPSKRLNVTK